MSMMELENEVEETGERRNEMSRPLELLGNIFDRFSRPLNAQAATLMRDVAPLDGWVMTEAEERDLALVKVQAGESL